MKSKTDQHWERIDIEARNVFGYCNPSMLKCVAGFNFYGERMKELNKHCKEVNCPRCGELETWEHVVQCRQISLEKDEMIKDLEKQ